MASAKATPATTKATTQATTLAATHLTTPEAFDLQDLDLEGDAYRHLFRARRLAVGETLRVVDGQGRARAGQIVKVDKAKATLELGDELPSLEPETRVSLLVGALRPERASWLVEKATELGVDRLTFFSSERTPRDYGRAKIDRWRRVAAAAVEQCGRSHLPALEGVLDLEEALEHSPEPRFAFLPRAEPFTQAIEKGPIEKHLTLLVGPEGGFGPLDLEKLKAHRAQPAGLGQPILRVETAALAALALVLCR